MENPLNMGLASFCCCLSCSETHSRLCVSQALIEIKYLAQEGPAPMGPGTFVVLPPLLCTALRPFRRIPLCAQDSGGGQGEGTRDALVAFPPVSPGPAALRTILYCDPLALRDLEASGTYRTLHSDILCLLHMTVGEGRAHSPYDVRTRGRHKDESPSGGPCVSYPPHTGNVRGR